MKLHCSHNERTKLISHAAAATPSVTEPEGSFLAITSSWCAALGRTDPAIAVVLCGGALVLFGPPETVALSDQVDRALLDLLVNPTEILADDTEADHLQPSKEEQHDHQRCVSRDRHAKDQCPPNDDAGIRELEQGDQQPHIRPGAERNGRERGEAVESEVPEFPNIPLGRAFAARRALKLHRSTFEAHPGEHPLHETLALGQRRQGLENLAI